MNEQMSAIEANLRETLCKVVKLRENIIRMRKTEKGGQINNEDEIIEKLKESSSVLIIFNDLFDEIENLMGL